jgi:hypothetical protein
VEYATDPQGIMLENLRYYLNSSDSVRAIKHSTYFTARRMKAQMRVDIQATADGLELLHEIIDGRASFYSIWSVDKQEYMDMLDFGTLVCSQIFTMVDLLRAAELRRQVCFDMF